MPSYNCAMILGNVGHTPKVTGSSGATAARFSVAVSERSTNRSGDREERTTWIDVVAFGRLAEVVREYVKRGSLVFVTGSLRTESYDDKATGTKRYRTFVVASNVQFLDRRDDDEQDPAPTEAMLANGGEPTFNRAADAAMFRSGRPSDAERLNAQTRAQVRDPEPTEETEECPF
jgi:single-strand DNA-binding protein